MNAPRRGGERRVAVDQAELAPQGRPEVRDHGALEASDLGHRSGDHGRTRAGEHERDDRLPLVRLDGDRRVRAC